MKAGKSIIDPVFASLDLAHTNSYAAKVSSLAQVLKSIDYTGPLTKTAINKVVNEFKEQLYEPLGGHYDVSDYVLSSYETTADILDKRSNTRAETKINNMFNKAMDVINSIDGTPLPGERMELVNGFNKKVNSRTFEFDFKCLSDTERLKFIQQMNERFWRPFLDKITLNQHWVITYWVNGRAINTMLSANKLHDLRAYIDEQNYDALLTEEADSPDSDNIFTADIHHIDRMVFTDWTYYGDEQPKHSRRGKSSRGPRAPRLGSKVVASFGPGQNYKSRGGRYWKWILTLPREELNLERYQIFNKLDADTVKIMAKEHCLVYALKQYGIPEVLTNTIKTHIGKRNFPMSKLNEIAELTNIEFRIRYYKNTNNDAPKPVASVYKPTTTTPDYVVKLLLYGDHYMLDESVDINLKYIELRRDMEANPINSGEWTLDKRMKVRGVYEGVYKISNAAKSSTLPELLRALFDNEYFRPITCAEYMKYASTLFKDDIEPLDSFVYSECDIKRIRDSDDQHVYNDLVKVFSKITKYRDSLGYTDADVKNTYDSIAKIVKTNTHLKYSVVYNKQANQLDLISRPVKAVFSNVIFADFEASTDGDRHVEYCICGVKCEQNSDTTIDSLSEYGPNCALSFLNWCDDHSLVYFHNLTYDINFLFKHFTRIKGTPIVFNGHDMSYTVEFDNKTIYIRDSNVLIQSKLSDFTKMFKLDSAKEAYPYNYYTRSNVIRGVGSITDAMLTMPPEQREQFVSNVSSVSGVKIGDDEFDMKQYALFYCNQDVRLLREGFMKFRHIILTMLDIDVFECLSVSSIADKYFKREIYYKNDNLYEVSGVVQNNMRKCIHGARCMTNNNEKQRVDAILEYMDAVSLYSAAIARAYIPEGKPLVIPAEWNGDYIIEHLFDDDQVEPTDEKNISAIYAKIRIDEIGQPLDFPLIVFKPELNPDMDKNIPRSSNTCCVMYVDHIMLEDLIKYQRIKFTLLGGYYYSGNRDTRCRDVIKYLFELRKQAQQDNNPIESVLKLILNSVYGKTMLKPIEHKLVYKRGGADADKYMSKNFNEIEQSEHMCDSDLMKFKLIKPINNHYNFSPFGIIILSMSKRIMNEVFSVARNANVDLYYQDTDSFFVKAADLPTIESKYSDSFGDSVVRHELIGGELGQFHRDFKSITASSAKPVGRKSLFISKKCYCIQLLDSEGNIAFHVRTKSITPNAIKNKASDMFPNAVHCEFNGKHFVPIGDYDDSSEFDVFKLYEHLYAGNEVVFDLVDEYTPRFDMRRDKTVRSKSHFYRTVRF